MLATTPQAAHTPAPESRGPLLDPLLVRLLVESEHARLNESVYEGTLPPLPPVVVEDNPDTPGRLVWTGPRHAPEVHALHVSATLATVEEVLEVARHELAHLACLVHFGDDAHSSVWKVNALLCGADTARCAR